MAAKAPGGQREFRVERSGDSVWPIVRQTRRNTDVRRLDHRRHARGWIRRASAAGGRGHSRRPDRRDRNALGPGERDGRRLGTHRRPGLRRRPHPLRCPGLLGPDRLPLALPRRHDRDRGQLRIQHRAALEGRRRIPDAHAGAGGGHAPREFACGRALGLVELRRISVAPRRTTRAQCRLHGRPLGDPPRRDGGARRGPCGDAE